MTSELSVSDLILNHSTLLRPMAPTLFLDARSGLGGRHTLKRRISQLLRVYDDPQFKIGITANYDKRRRSDDYKGYEEFLVLYVTSSLRLIRETEVELIRYYREHCENVASGGEGSISQAVPPYYLYVAMRERVAEPLTGKEAVSLGLFGLGLVGLASRARKG